MKKKEMKKRLEKEKRSMREFDSNSNINLKTVLILTFSVIGFVLLMFAFTKIKTGEWNLFTKNNNVLYKAEIQSTKILCGSILNRKDTEYYVLAYEMAEDNAVLYNSILEKYNNSQNKFPIYTLDLSNSRNNICLGDTLNITNDITKLKLTVPTLLKVSNKQIVSSKVSYDDIKNELFVD